MGGGQRMTCRGLARVGQLILDEGLLPQENPPGEPVRLVAAQFIAELSRPQYPDAFTTLHGFLAWLNRKGVAPGFCCAPRWCWNNQGNMWSGYGGNSLYGIIGDDIAMGFDWQIGRCLPGLQAQSLEGPEDAMVALHYLGRLLIVLPSTNTLVVTMGHGSLLGGDVTTMKVTAFRWSIVRSNLCFYHLIEH